MHSALEPDHPLDGLSQLDPRPEVPAEWHSGGPAPDGLALLHGGVLEALSDAVAIVDGDVVTTGTELAARAASVAAAVRPLPAGAPVAILLPRSADAVAAVLGASAAGAPYVPLDPEQPAARLGHMVRKAKAAALITTAGIEVPGGLPAILMEELEPAASVENHSVKPHDLAYLLFTSGSTGEPKGALVEHRSIANTISWLTRDLQATAADRFSWFSSPGFDASVIEVWPALRVGGTLHIAPAALRYDPAGLRDWLIESRITIAFMPTPMGELLLDLPWPTDGSVALRHLVTGGDALHRRAPANAPFRLRNAYGPTEAAVVSTWTEVSPDGIGAPAIGRPVPGTWVRVVDSARRPVRLGEPGELLIGGIQLARGYAEPTPDQAARFAGTGADRYYRTGDIVRWNAEGELEFLHRIDQQVQIRGFRVEPQEVEQQLVTLPGVREGAVKAWTDAHGTVRLAAYLVVVSGVTVPELRERLSTRLPEYMIPVTWQVLASLPLTPNGKVNRAALPQPSVSERIEGAQPTSGSLEQLLSAVWAAELGLDSVSPDDTFFELGGHSLSAIKLVNHIRADLDVRLDVADFLRSTTVRGLARLLSKQFESESAAESNVRAGRDHQHSSTGLPQR